MASIRSIDPVCARPPPLKRLTAAQSEAFARDGFLFLPGLFDAAEIGLLRRRLAEADAALESRRFYILDTTGGRWVSAPDLGPYLGGPIAEVFRPRMPDGAIFLPDGTAAFTPYMNDRLIGHHGGLSPEERLIPLLVRG